MDSSPYGTTTLTSYPLTHAHMPALEPINNQSHLHTIMFNEKGQWSPPEISCRGKEKESTLIA